MSTRFTNLRKEILRVIDKAEKPLSAKLIKKRIKAKTNLSSVYRALDFLKTKRLIQTISFSGIIYYYISEKGHGHFLVCKECHEIIEFKDCIVKHLQRKIQNQFNYEITDHVLYFTGLCSTCKNYLQRKERVMSQE